MGLIAITGGAGFIGSHVTRQLLDAGHDVLVVDFFQQYIHPLKQTFMENMNYRYEVLLNGARVVRANVTNKDGLRRVFNEHKPTRLLHLAALPLANVALRQTEEAFEGIIEGTTNLLEIVRDMDSFDKFVYVSSSMIYGDFTQDPMPEDGFKEPKEIYGGMKYCGEILTRVYAQRYGFPYALIRPSAVYGPTDNNRRVIQIFLENAFRGETIGVKNGPTTKLDFTFVEDVAAGMAAVLTQDASDNQAFNITRGDSRTLSEAAHMIKGYFPDLHVEEKSDANSFRPKRGTLDTSKICSLLKYKPKYELSSGIERYYQHMKAHNPSLMSGK